MTDQALAKLEDLKAELELAGDKYDDLLTSYLLTATAEAERIVGRPLVRQVDKVEHPTLASVIGWRTQRCITLELTPVEAVSEVLQIAHPGGDFDADGHELVEGQHYVLHATRGRLEAIAIGGGGGGGAGGAGGGGGGWPAGPRTVRVTYTAGYLPPDEDDGSPELAEAARVPPSLARGIIQQAATWWNQRGKAGLEQVGGGAGGGGGNAQFQRPGVMLTLQGQTNHPELIRACMARQRFV